MIILVLCIIIIITADNNLLKGIALAGCAYVLYSRFISSPSAMDSSTRLLSNNNQTIYTKPSLLQNGGSQKCFERSVKSYKGGNGNSTGKGDYAKWLNVNIKNFRKKLQENGAVLVHRNKKYLRYAYAIPKGYVRIRKEYNDNEEPVVTMTSKTYHGRKQPEENEIEVNMDFETAHEFLKSLKLQFKAYQETYREKYRLPGCKELVIDTVPGFHPFVEINCDCNDLWEVAENLELEKKDARFGGLANMFEEEYGIRSNLINDHLRKLTFDTVYDALKDKVTKNKDVFKEVTADFQYD